MKTILHVLTRPDDALAREIIARQQGAKENKIDVVELTKNNADYKALLEKVFSADAVQIW